MACSSRNQSVAESPLFIPRGLRTNLATAAREIVAQISQPALIEKMKGSEHVWRQKPGA